MADAGCPIIVSNPDLVGIGTRLNFYVTMLLAAIIPQSEYTVELLNELYMNAIFFGLALLITVLVQTIQGRLDLYHAIFVMHILLCLSVYQNSSLNTFIVTWRYSFKRRITLALQLFGVLFIFPAWALYVWTKDSQLGLQPQCNDLVKYVFFFVSVRGTVNWLRMLAIICFSIRMYGSLIIFSATFSVYKVMDSDQEMDIEDMGHRFRGSLSRISFSPILAAVYGIVTTELIIHRNRPHVQVGENNWGFGQLVSVLLLGPIFIEILVIVKRLHSSRG